MVQQRLRITEIFFSLQGETRTVGVPTVFVRLTGCPLRCQYCDSAYAFQGGDWMSLEQIVSEVQKYRATHVTISGGEPLAQKACLPLMKQLCDLDYHVSIETSGAMDVSGVDHRVVKVIDIKTPGSMEVSRNLWDNLMHLRAADQLKFVICDRNDYEWAKSVLVEHHLCELAEVLFSPSFEQLPAVELANWILEDQLPVRFQMQMHKYLWGDVPGK